MPHRVPALRPSSSAASRRPILQSGSNLAEGMFKSARHVDIRGVWRNARERIRLCRVQNRSVDSLALCNKIAVALCNTPPSHFVITSITLCNKLSQKIFLTSKVSSLSLLDSFPPPPPLPPPPSPPPPLDDDVTSQVAQIMMLAVRVPRSYRLYK